MSISFALIDAKEGDIIDIFGYPKTENNIRIKQQMTVEYLKKIKIAQDEILSEYTSKLDLVGEDVDWEKEDEISWELCETLTDEIENLYYT